MMKINELYVWGGTELKPRNLRDAVEKMNDVEMLRLSVKKFKLLKKKALDDNCIPTWSGILTCPLCVKYYYGKACARCPVRKYTGASYCKATPYIDILIIAKLGCFESFVIEIDNEIKFLNKIIRKLVRQKSQEERAG